MSLKNTYALKCQGSTPVFASAFYIAENTITRRDKRGAKGLLQKIPLINHSFGSFRTHELIAA